MELKNLIISLEKRPMMYINNTDIFMLSTFINGFLLGKSDLSKIEKAFVSDFHNFVQEFYEVSYNLPWWNMIYCLEGNHHKAFERFFDLYKRWYENYRAKDETN